MDNTRDLGVLIRSRHPLIIADTLDEQRFLGILRRAAQAAGVPVWTWSLTKGLCRDGGQPAPETSEAVNALSFVSRLSDPGVFVFQDVQSKLDDPVVLRQIKDIAQEAKAGVTLVLAVSAKSTPLELKGLALSWTLVPPTTEEITELLRRTLSEFSGRMVPVALDREAFASMVEALRGLSTAEASQLVQEAALNDGQVDAADIEFLRKARADLLQSDGVLEMIESTAETLDNVGGMPHLKEWLALRGRAFESAAKEFGLDPPRGVLLTGVPGCGKSLVAKTLARTWGMPLMLLDPARLYGQYVGQSEERLRESLKTVEAMAPAVLWIDEIEKGLAAGAESDGGVSERLRGTFLRWMQDRPPGVFLVATCNQVQSLPPEFLRRGRFDEIFFVDLPGESERDQIFGLHLVRRKRDPAAYDTSRLAGLTDGFSGAEIEAVVVGALYRAFAANTELTQAALEEEVAATIPLSRSRAEDIAALREWAKTRTVPA